MRMKKITEEIGKILTGKDAVVEKVLMAVAAGGNVLLEDVPGTGKTTLALALSKVLDLEYKRIQFTPDTIPSDITGFCVYQPGTGEMTLKEGAVFCNLLLADEINRTSPRTQAALLEALEEKKVTIDSVSYPLPKPFVCIATQNPAEMAGTQPLPESELDRFMVCLTMGYPTPEEQMRILRNRKKTRYMVLNKIVDRTELSEFQERVQDIWVADEILEYMIALCEATQNDPRVEIGVSPRGLIALMDMAKASAALHQRDFVIPEDVENLFFDVCTHRIRLTQEAELEEMTGRMVLEEIYQRITPPDRRKAYQKTL